MGQTGTAGQGTGIGTRNRICHASPGFNRCSQVFIKCVPQEAHAEQQQAHFPRSMLGPRWPTNCTTIIFPQLEHQTWLSLKIFGWFETSRESCVVSDHCVCV